MIVPRGLSSRGGKSKSGKSLPLGQSFARGSRASRDPSIGVGTPGRLWSIGLCLFNRIEVAKAIRTRFFRASTRVISIQGDTTLSENAIPRSNSLRSKVTVTALEPRGRSEISRCGPSHCRIFARLSFSSVRTTVISCPYNFAA
jgi:hypothetical protein